MMRPSQGRRRSSPLVLLLLVVAAAAAAAAVVVVVANSPPYATFYRAEITEIPGTDSGVTGFVYVIASGDDGSSIIGYAGHVMGLEPDLLAPTCTAVNGCGVHVHAGFSCENVEGQGGHYFQSPITQEDPWVEHRYSSNFQGQAKFSGIVDIGTDDLAGRAFLIHAEDGSRVACGRLWQVAGFKLLRASPSALSKEDSGGVVVVAAATVTAHAVGDQICFFVAARGLEPNIDSYLMTDGTDCTSQNGCGLHVHSGDSCHDTDAQGGHYYNADSYNVDPWLDIGYLYTDSNGSAYHADCVTTGETVYADHAFLVHANDGSRVACDILSKPGTDYCDYYCKRNDNDGYQKHHHEKWCNDCYNYCKNH